MATQKQEPLLMTTLMKDVSQALKYDRKDQCEEAYRKYLECTLRISSGLLKNLLASGGHLAVTPDEVKMVKLGQQCMERISVIQASNFKPTKPSTSNLKRSLSQGSIKGQSQPPLPSPSRESNAGTKQLGSYLEPSMVKKHGQKKTSPMELAELQNKQLLLAFKARQSRQSKNRSQAINRSLTLQRKMAENLAIAKVQEKILAQKMLERQQRLEQQAAQRFPAPLGLTEEDLYQRQVYKKVLEFEQEELWVVDLRKKIAENPFNIDVISNLVTSILQCDSHPLTEELANYQNRILHKISPLVEGQSKFAGALQIPLSDTQMQDLMAEIPNVENVEDSLDNEDKIELTPVIPEQSYGISDNTKAEDNSNFEKAPEDEDTESGAENDDHSLGGAIMSEERVDDVNVTSDDNLEDATSSLRSDIEKSLSICEQEKERLEMQVKTLSKQFTEDYEKYNQDNLDDLFEDDSDEILENKSLSGDVEDSDSKQFSVDGNEPIKKNIASRSSPNYSHTACKRFTAVDKKIAKLNNEAYHRHLKGIVDDILTSIEKVQVLFVIVFEELRSAEGRDQCNVLLEDYFFRPIWSHLLLLFRLANRPKEILLARQMTKNLSAIPTDVYVRQELCLSPDPATEGPTCCPYEPAILEIRAIVNCHTMLEKLECLVRSSRLVVHCVEQHYKQKEEHTPSIGADDLLPVLCYLVLKSCLPQLVSECHAMDRLIHEGYMLGEEGYCLTSFQTAINFLISEEYRETNGS